MFYLHVVYTSSIGIRFYSAMKIGVSWLCDHLTARRRRRSRPYLQKYQNVIKCE